MKGKLQSDGVTPVSQYQCILDVARFPYKSLANKGAGRVFPMLFSIIKPLLAPATKSKIKIYGSPSNWKPALLKNKNLPENILPPAYGGTNTVSEYGINMADTAGLGEDTEVEFYEVMLPGAERLVVAFKVAEKNNTLSWALNTGTSGVGLVVSRGDKVYFESKGLLDSHLKQVEGSVKCDESGDYTLTFDNTSSGEGQELKYRVDVRSASGAKQLSFD